MKHMNRIRFLALLLCAVLLLAACSRGEQPAADAPAENPTPDAGDGGAGTPSEPTVDPVLKNFFTYTNVKPWKTLSSVTRMEGNPVDNASDVVLLRDSSIDLMNKVTETFTAYNVADGTVVLTLTNTYTYHADYTPFDWDAFTAGGHEMLKDPDARYPENVMDVRIVGRDEGMIHLIEVRRASITTINKDVHEDAIVHFEVRPVYEYYDITGQKLVESVHPAKDLTPHDGVVTLVGANVLFDLKTGKAISITDADGKITRIGYDVENETYGYYLDQSQPFALGASRQFFEVYNKADGACVLRYYLKDADDAIVYPLESGNVLIQYLIRVEEGMDYDVFDGEDFYLVESGIVDILTGKMTELELDYRIMAMMSRQELIDALDPEAYGIYASENVLNFAVVIPITEQKLLDANGKLLVLNNNGETMYEFTSVIPEHRIGSDPNFFGFSVLSNGDYLVELVENGTGADRAIVTQDGQVRSYLIPAATVAGEYVVLEGGIYDFDLNLLYSFSEHNVRFERTVGTRILVSEIPETVADPSAGTVFHEVYREEGQFLLRSVFGGENVTVVDDGGEDYVHVLDVDTGKHVLYNMELSHLLTSQAVVEILSCGDRYLVHATVIGDGSSYDVFYIIEE